MKNRYLIYIALLILTLSITLGVTYAYIAAKINNRESSSTIKVESGQLSITYENNSGNIILNNIIPGDSVTKQFTLTGINNTKPNAITTNTDLKYKIGIVIDTNTFSEGALTYSLTKDSTSSSNGKTADDSTGTIKSSGTQYIGNGYFVSGANNDKHIYNLTISFPDTNEDQSIDQGASFACHVTIAHDIKMTATEYLTKLDKTSNGLEIDDTTDKNLRYVGANQNNYLKFNDETWRIVGVFNNITTIDKLGKEKKESLVKIVRNDSLGNYSWDSSESKTNSGYGINEWSQADLMYELNCDGSGSTAYCRSDIEEGYLSNLTTGTTTWYNGSNNAKNGTYDYSKNIKSSWVDKIATVRWNTSRTTYGASALNSYNHERSTTLISTPSDNIPRTNAWDGKIALIYPSDYGYASTDTKCRSGLSSSNCKNENWLANNTTYWTSSPDSGFAYYVFGVASGGLVSYSFANRTYGVRPALFLKSDIIITGGFGDESDPYEIEVEQSETGSASFATDSWSTIAKNVKSDPSTYSVGSEKEIEIDGTSYTVRIANNTTPDECSGDDFSQTACGFVVEFVDIVEERQMNSTDTNVGGWKDSAMRTYANGDFYNNLPEELRKVIIDTKVISGHGSTSGETNFTSIDKIYLLSEHEVWEDGTSNQVSSNDTAYNNTRQLDYYKSKGVTTSNYSGAIKNNNGDASTWWLRGANSNNGGVFLSVGDDGDWGSNYAHTTNGLAPAFRIG